MRRILRGLGSGLALMAVAQMLAGCATTAQLEALATQGSGTACSGPQVNSYHDLFDSVVSEQAQDIRLVQRAIEGAEVFAELSAASRRARDREIALRRADVPQCLAETHLYAIQSAEEMSRAVERVLGGEPQAARALLSSAADNLDRAQGLLERAGGG